MQVIIFSQNPGRPRIRDISYGLPVVQCTHRTCTWSILAPFPDAVVCSSYSRAVDREREMEAEPAKWVADRYCRGWLHYKLLSSSSPPSGLKSFVALRIGRRRGQERRTRESECWLICLLGQWVLPFCCYLSAWILLDSWRIQIIWCFKLWPKVNLLLWSIWYIVLRRLINNWNLR